MDFVEFVFSKSARQQPGVLEMNNFFCEPDLWQEMIIQTIELWAYGSINKKTVYTPRRSPSFEFWVWERTATSWAAGSGHRPVATDQFHIAVHPINSFQNSPVHIGHSYTQPNPTQQQTVNNPLQQQLQQQLQVLHLSQLFIYMNNCLQFWHSEPIQGVRSAWQLSRVTAWGRKMW